MADSRWSAASVSFTHQCSMALIGLINWMLPTTLFYSTMAQGHRSHRLPSSSKATQRLAECRGTLNWLHGGTRLEDPFARTFIVKNSRYSKKCFITTFSKSYRRSTLPTTAPELVFETIGLASIPNYQPGGVFLPRRSVGSIVYVSSIVNQGG